MIAFFGLGGDSIIAMRFVAATRAKRVKVTVADVVRNPTRGMLSFVATGSFNTHYTPRMSTGHSSLESRRIFISSLKSPFLSKLHWKGS